MSGAGYDKSCGEGPPSIYRALWTSLHTTSFYIDQQANDNVEAQQAFIDYVNNIYLLLPCTNCAEHVTTYLSNNPLPTPGTYSITSFPFARWVVDLHNDVNRRQGKPAVAFETARAHYVDDGPPPQCPAFAVHATDNDDNDIRKHLHAKVHDISKQASFSQSALTVSIVINVVLCVSLLALWFYWSMR